VKCNTLIGYHHRTALQKHQTHTLSMVAWLQQSTVARMHQSRRAVCAGVPHLEERQLVCPAGHIAACWLKHRQAGPALRGAAHTAGQHSTHIYQQHQARLVWHTTELLVAIQPALRRGRAAASR
jgi:hypothetical protein